MSFLRGVAKSVFGLLFTLSLITAITIFSLAQFTEAENIKGVVSDVLQSRGGVPVSSGNADLMEGLRESCANDDLGSLEVRVGGVTLTCDEIESLGTQEGVSDLVSSEFVDSVYFREYGCGFLDCLRTEDPFPLIITQHAHRFYRQSLSYAILATLVFGAAFVASARGLKDRLRSPGFSLLWSSLPFVVISFFVGDVVSSFVPEQIASTVATVSDGLVSATFMIYLYVLVAGVVLIAAGFVIREPKNNSPGRPEKNS